MQISEFFPEWSSRENLLKVQHMVARRAMMKDDFKDILCIAAADQAFLDTFLSFREGPAIVKTYKKLKTRPYILFIS
jgi:deoxyinosine 3'endonuclease (endonuclease V)